MLKEIGLVCSAKIHASEVVLGCTDVVKRKEHIQDDFGWPGMDLEVKRSVRNCNECSVVTIYGRTG